MSTGSIKTAGKTIITVAIGVLVGGLIMQYGKQLPLVKQAQNGYQGIV